jgi:O-antigen/teichoic acid export membrane protein
MEPSKPLSLRRNFSWTFIGNGVYAACQWGMLVLLAKLGSPEIVGQFTLGLAVTAPVLMFTNLHLRTLQATDAKGEYLFSDYLGLRLIMTGLALLIITAITLISRYRWETSLVILLIGLAKAFESISDVFHGLFQQHERMDRIAVSLMIKGSLSLLLLGIGLYISNSALWGVLGLVLAWAVVLVGYDIRNGDLILKQMLKVKDIALRVQPRWYLKTLGKLVQSSLPLGFVMMLISLNGNIPRYFIEKYLGERELGIFAAIAYLMVAGSMVALALGESANPKLAKYYASGNTKAFYKLLLKLLGIGALLSGMAILIAVISGKQILTILYNIEYAQYSDLLAWLMVAAGISYICTFLNCGMMAARYFHIQIPLFTLVATTSTIGCLWLLPSMGLKGAAIALLLSAVVQMTTSSGVIIYAFHRHQKQA